MKGLCLENKAVELQNPCSQPALMWGRIMAEKVFREPNLERVEGLSGKGNFIQSLTLEPGNEGV